MVNLSLLFQKLSYNKAKQNTMQNIFWYYNRLKTMSFIEIFYRIGQQLQKYFEYLFIMGKKCNFKFKRLAPRILPYSKLTLECNNIEYVYIFNERLSINENIDWHLDVSSGKHYPKKFCKFINVRDGKLGSAKHVWEVNRMSFLLYFAIKYRVDNNIYFLNKIISIVKNWIIENPYLLGVNWHSNIEVNIRLIVWFFVWEILDMRKLISDNIYIRNFVETYWIPSIYQHCKFSYRNPSKYSSGNNHRIAEAAGLFIASSYWIFSESEKWGKYAKKVLEKEIIKQHSENGINKEEASQYIQFVTDFLMLALIMGERTNNRFSIVYYERLKKIFEYIYELTDKSCNYIRYGDGDDGIVLNFGFDRSFNNFRSLLITGALLFNNYNFATKAQFFDIKNEILFGDKGKKRFYTLKRSTYSQKTKFYEKEGHFFLRSFKGGVEFLVHVNAAPLGFLSIAAHGHADALSFSVHVNSIPVLVDCGTYTYHTDIQWRKYFTGTLSHNTVRIDCLDQARKGGSTMWLDRYFVKILKHLEGEEYDYILAEHDGYRKYGCIHKRAFKFYKKDKILEISDYIEVLDNKIHKIEIPYHFHPHVVLKKINESIFEGRLKDNSISFYIYLNSTLPSEIIRGRISPVLGWYSNNFGVKEPTSVLYISGSIDRNIDLSAKVVFK